MEDLGHALAGAGDVAMLGGGNPAHIPEVQSFLLDCMQRICRQPGEFARLVGDYDPPRGEPRFIAALADLLRAEYGWDIGPENIALTTGSQSAFFQLFNMLAGRCSDGTVRRILLPVTPEYIGYADVGLTDGLFTARRPSIETFPDGTFKYHVDFDHLEVGPDIAAICVSRPTNPTGNVLSDDEMDHLHGLARERDIPLIIDNAYGKPFPNIIFCDVRMPWSAHVILSMSLSKLGLPGARTGIVVARPEIASALAAMNAVFSLSLGSFGPAVTLDLITSGEVLRLSNNVIRPYYERKARATATLLRGALQGVPFRIHRAEGAIFLWVWFPGLPIPSEELYRRLKARDVVVLSGHHFFPGLDGEWAHRHECLRISFAMPEAMVARGVQAIGEEVKRAFRDG
jgi:valine--pyruvate aminotransferase